MRVVLAALVVVLAAGCLQSHSRDPPSMPGRGDWFVLNATGSPEGTFTLFHFVVPNGTHGALDERGYHALVFDYVPWAEDPRHVLEWGLFAYDTFLDGPHTGKLRPQNQVLFPGGWEREGFPDPVVSAADVPLEPGRFDLRNRTGYDDREVWILLLVRTHTPSSFQLALDMLEGKSWEWGDGPKTPRMIPDRRPIGLGSHRVLEPVASRQGFQMAAFHDVFAPPTYYSFISQGIAVSRSTAGMAFGVTERLTLASNYTTPRGWTFVNARLDGSTRVAAFDFRADYRGEKITARGAGADYDGVLYHTVGSLGVPNHYVYRDGANASRFQLELSYADEPTYHIIKFMKVDLSEDLSVLAGVPTYQHALVLPRFPRGSEAGHIE